MPSGLGFYIFQLYTVAIFLSLSLYLYLYLSNTRRNAQPLPALLL